MYNLLILSSQWYDSVFSCVHMICVSAIIITFLILFFKYLIYKHINRKRNLKKTEQIVY